MRKLPLILISLLVVLILFLVLCTFVQREYEQIVVYRFGNVVRPTTLAYNWKLCLPTDRLVRVDRRAHLYQSILQQVVTPDSTLAVRVFAAWRITDGNLFAQRLNGSDEEAKTYLDSVVNSAVNNELGKQELSRLFNTNNTKLAFGELEARIRDAVNERMKDMGMQIDQVGFARMAFPPNVANDVYKRMVAERNGLAMKHINEGQSEANDILSKGNTERERILSEAKSIAAAKRGAGEAEAVAILGKATNTKEAKEFWEYMKSMDLYRSVLTKNTYLVLPADSLLLQSLLTPPAGTAGATTRPK